VWLDGLDQLKNPMKHALETVSCGMIYMKRFMTIGSGIQVTLWVLPQQFERL
jgi:hypothetical protein